MESLPKWVPTKFTQIPQLSGHLVTNIRVITVDYEGGGIVITVYSNTGVVIGLIQ